MKPVHFYISTALGALCLILSIALFILASSARNRQAELQKLQAQYQTQQDIITTGITIGQQIGPNVLKDMAAAAAEDPAMKAVLAKHGYNPDAAAGSVPK